MANPSLDLTAQLEADLKEAMVARDEIKTSVIRLLKAALQNQQIELGHELSPNEIIQVLQKEAKKRHDAAIAYDQAGRSDLAQAEKTEEVAISQYLPEQMNEAELTALVSNKIAELGATSKADMGRVISAVMTEVAGRADGARVSQLAREKLS